MKVTLVDGYIQLDDGDNFVRVIYTENKATIGCNGNYLYITADQFTELSKLMAAVNAYALINGVDNGE